MLKKLRDRFLGAKLNVKLTILVVSAVLLPIVFFSVYFFNSMKETAIHERKSALQYSMNQSYEQILKNVESINMSTQFILSDQELVDFLIARKKGVEYSTEDLIDFTSSDIVALERMVNNNLYLYQVRVYVDDTKMQEVMPLLYRQDRMQRLDWAQDEVLAGWKYDYMDQIFDSFRLYQNQKIMSLVTPIENYLYGEIGILEVAMKMDTMFPMLYEQTEGEWNYFVDNQGNVHCREDIKLEQEEYLPQVLDEVTDALGAEQQSITTMMKPGGQLAVVGGIYIKELDGYLIGIRSMEAEMTKIFGMQGLFLLMMVLFLGTVIFFSNYMVKRMLKQFYGILHSIRAVQKGNLDVVITDCGSDEMGELGTQINTMLAHIKQLMEDNLNRELLMKNSEIRALQNQINAHFIYNVLESIKMMAEIDEEYEISDSITILGKLLRYSMKWTSGNVTVEQEVDYIRNYLVLINLRFDYEIHLSLNIPEEIMAQKIPKMSLQPIVENAICHGIEQIAEDTTIYMKGFRQDEDCIIEITDAGRGMSEEEVVNLYRKISGEIDSGGGSGNGIGLKNVQDRIKMSFGERYGLEIHSKLGCYTKIRVRVPMNKVYLGEKDEDGINC